MARMSEEQAQARKGEMLVALAEMGVGVWYPADWAFRIAEHEDYDEVCQQATDHIAEVLGIAKPDEDEDWEGTEYGIANEIANEQISDELAEMLADDPTYENDDWYDED